MKRTGISLLMALVTSVTVFASQHFKYNFSIAPLVNASDTIPDRAVYKDLNTGRLVQVFYNRRDMRSYNIRTKDPLQFYVNTSNGDTLYGRGELVVNGYLVKGADGRYEWDPNKVEIRGDEIKIKDGAKKVVIEDDKMKIKDENGKMKTKIKS